MTNKESQQQANMPYPYPMAFKDNDEIDLIELFRTLWKQKAKIALVTAATTLAAGIYAFTAEEVWTSKAVITAPKAADMGQFYQVAQEISRNASDYMQILNEQAKSDTTSGDDAVINESQDGLSLYNLRRSLYSDFKKELSSNKNKSSSLFNHLFPDGNVKFLGVSFVPSDGKKIIYDSINLSANNPHAAKVLLEEYIDYINLIVLNKNKQELAILNDKLSRDISGNAAKLASNAKEQLKREMNSVLSALSQSKAMNISESAVNLPAEINNTTMYLLGSKALASKLVLLQASEPVLPNRYFELQEQLKSLRAVHRLDLKN